MLITPIAHQHIQEAYDYYYEKVSQDIADKFFNDLQEIYRALSINPFYQIRTKQYRAIPLKKFPYLLFFEMEEQKKFRESVGIIPYFAKSHEVAISKC